MKIVLDIETVQAPRDEWERLMGINPDADQHRSEPIASDLFALAEHEEQRKRENEQYARSSFDGTFSRIVCIGILVFSRSMEPQVAMAWYGKDEKMLLQQYWDRIAEFRPSLFITHNGLGFDLPFIKKRSVIHQVRPTMDINLAKFRQEPVYDTMAIWSNWDTRGWVKLDVLARALNVETKSGSGSDVARLWEAQDGKAIAEYCLQDTYVTYACYQRMTFHEPLAKDQVLQTVRLIDVG